MLPSKYTIAAPTDGDPHRWKQLLDSFEKNTVHPERFNWIILDNFNAWNHSFIEEKKWLESLGCDVDHAVPNSRMSLARAWDSSLQCSKTHWTFLINDDIVFNPRWDEQWELIKNNQPLFDMFLLCEPYNWSGFVVNKNWYNKFAWMLNKPQFPAGYYEDDYIYLEMADYYTCKTKKDVYTKAIYCVPFNLGFGLFEHKHIPPASFANKWDKMANFKAFSKYWTEVHPGYPDGIEAKDGKYYVRAGN